MNTTIHHGTIATASNPVVTQAMIAKKMGVSPATVSHCLNGYSSMPASTIALVKATAKEMGYKTLSERKALRQQKKEEDYLLSHNFPSREVETRRMEYLRAQGYSNADIAKAIGRGKMTVYRRIGSQPKDMTSANCAYGQKKRAQLNEHRRIVAADHTVNVYNAIVTDIAEVKSKMITLEGRLKEIRPDAIKASRISKVKMIRDISDTAHPIQ